MPLPLDGGQIGKSQEWKEGNRSCGGMAAVMGCQRGGGGRGEWLNQNKKRFY